MYEDSTILEKLEELASLIRILDTRIQFVQQDLEDLKQGELTAIKLCVEQLAQKQLNEIHDNAAKQWTVERL
jgi:archaellum component FlaC